MTTKQQLAPLDLFPGMLNHQAHLRAVCASMLRAVVAAGTPDEVAEALALMSAAVAPGSDGSAWPSFGIADALPVPRPPYVRPVRAPRVPAWKRFIDRESRHA